MMDKGGFPTGPRRLRSTTPRRSIRAGATLSLLLGSGLHAAAQAPANANPAEKPSPPLFTPAVIGTTPRVRMLRPAGPEEASQELRPVQLRCEALRNPVGLDVATPRLDWKLSSAGRGQRQTAYRILVASSAEALAREDGDLWDSGKIQGTQTLNHRYAGKPLSSDTDCFWKVKVWDKDDKAGEWSEPARWSTGMLPVDNWQAEWIGYDGFRARTFAEAPLGQARWIKQSADNAPLDPKAPSVLLTEVEIPGGVSVDSAVLYANAEGRYRVFLNGHLVTGADPAENPMLVSTTEARHYAVAGVNTLRAEVIPAASDAQKKALIARLVIQLSDGRTIERLTDDSWRTVSASGNDWQSRAISLVNLPAVEAKPQKTEGPRLQEEKLFLPPAPLFRADFTTAKPVQRAVLYVAALGNADFYLNGQRVNACYFPSGWTDYNKRVLYRAFDVTSLIQGGPNTLGAILADGWFSGYIGSGRNREHYGRNPRLKAELHLRHADGTHSVVASGPGWKAAAGPHLEADLLMGERYDARALPQGWALPGFDSSSWSSVAVGAPEVKPYLHWHPAPEVLPIAELTPVSIREHKPGVWILDLGQNFAGSYRLKVQAPAGTEIRLRFAERLNPDGSLYTTNLREARVEDTYICSGNGTELYEPRFTYHGFQFVEVRGLPQKPGEDAFTGIALSSATPETGRFESSDPVLAKMVNNIRWTQRANFLEVPTDSPQRDERLGSSGGAQIYAKTATLLADVQAFLGKWMVDLEDAQRPDGQFPAAAPLRAAGDDGGPAWADAGVLVPSDLYEAYGDRAVLEDHYAAQLKFIEFCQKRFTPELLPPAQFHAFGDPLSHGAETPKDVIASAYFALSAKKAADTAEILGKKEDADRLRKLHAGLVTAFRKAYASPEGRIRGETQTAYALAIDFGLLEPAQAVAAGAHLAEDVQKKGNHLSTGFVGTRSLLPALTKTGHSDLAFQILLNPTLPGWSYPISQGATSVWERWDGFSSEKGFADPSLNSFSQCSPGAVYQWLVEDAAGIRLRNTGAKPELRFTPHPGGGIQKLKIRHDSAFGAIESGWEQTPDGLHYRCVVPPSLAGELLLPGSLKSTSPLPPPADDGQIHVPLESGAHEFVFPDAHVKSSWK